MKFFSDINRLFPVWAVGFALVAVWQPQVFTPLAAGIRPLLAVVMFAMGLALSRPDFTRVARQPSPIGIGVLLQFIVMPLAAFVISRMLGLDSALTTGMVLVGATAGGTASNVMSWLAGGYVALSVSMTLTSTIVSVVATPLLAWLYVGQSVQVPVLDMFASIAELVVVPIAAGVAIHHLIGARIHNAEPLFATAAMATIVLIIAIVVALNAGKITTLGPLVALAVILHNGIGLASGYGIARLFGFDRRTARTTAFEVGMQNSGLAVALAQQFFTAAAALPGALFSVWHNVSGSILAGYWRRQDASANKAQPETNTPPK
ncbi:bile acid:sodium symporter family protein [Salinisphaera sp. USBA-960]|nr:bile acid:sodium symporter family protein [Salifodinibacter halophilus]NNC26983.1 bile acid:sodium symporter family protein [Salifodinibacter halophilus]